MLARPSAPPAATSFAPPAAGTGSGAWVLIALALGLSAAAARIGWRAHVARLAEEERRAELAAAARIAQARAAARATLRVAEATPVAASPSTAPPFAAASAPAPAPPRPAASLPSFPWADGARGFRAASTEQVVSGAPLLLYFHTDWCPYCKQFDRDVLPDPGVSAALAPALKVRIDPEKGGDEHEIARRFGVTGYPTVLLVAKDGAAPLHLPSGVARGEAPQPATFAEAVREQLAHAWDADATAHVNSGRLDDAIREADLLLAYQPRDASGRGYYLRALAFHKKGELAEALRDYRAGCAAGCASCCAAGR